MPMAGVIEVGRSVIRPFSLRPDRSVQRHVLISVLKQN